MENPNTKWRHGRKPDYTTVDALFMKEKTRRHQEGSLEKQVEDIVKTFEMETTHKCDLKDWKSLDIPNFKLTINGNPRSFSAQDLLDIGSFNAVLHNHHLHEEEDRESIDKAYNTAFPAGFAWEVLEIQSGPPTVALTWRHWGRWTGLFKGHKPTGETIEMVGSCVATVTDDLKLQAVQIYYDPTALLATLNAAGGRKCPFLLNATTKTKK